MSRHDLKIEGHPANTSFRPDRDPDFTYQFGNYKFWFKEMMCSRTRSDTVEDYPELLAVCPASGRLMYMSRYVPTSWHLINDIPPNEAYREFVNKTIDQEVLGGT